MAAWASLLYMVSAAMVVVTEASIVGSPKVPEDLITHDPLRSHVKSDAPGIADGIHKDTVLPATLLSHSSHSIHPHGHLTVHPTVHSVKPPITHSDAHPINHHVTHNVEPDTHIVNHPPTNNVIHPATNIADHPNTNLVIHPATHIVDHPATQINDHPAPHPATHLVKHPNTNIVDHPATHINDHPAQHFIDLPGGLPDPLHVDHPAPPFIDHPASLPGPQPFVPPPAPLQPELPLSSLHQLGYNPYIYNHPYPESVAHFPKHGYNVVEDLDGAQGNFPTTPQYFPGDGYELDHYFDNFPGFGYFSSVPQYDNNHGFSTVQHHTLPIQSHTEGVFKDGPPLSRSDVENVSFHHIPKEVELRMNSGRQIDTQDAPPVIQKPSEIQKHLVLSRVPRKVSAAAYFMSPPHMPSLPLARITD